MTIDEIFIKINTHMSKGILMHQHMNQIYQFLGLQGYAKCQEYHYNEEVHMQIKFQHYYISHYFKLLTSEMVTLIELIPNSWYRYTAREVDINTKRNCIKELMEKWIEWEKETKHLYEEMYLELTRLKEIAAALYITKLIKDVDEELSNAQQLLLDLEAIGFNLDVIIDWQPNLIKLYKE